MKKLYTAPVISVRPLDMKDVLTASIGDNYISFNLSEQVFNLD